MVAVNANYKPYTDYVIQESKINKKGIYLKTKYNCSVRFY